MTEMIDTTATVEAPPEAATPEEDNGGPFQTECAFVCYLMPDGHWIADSTLINQEIQVARDANSHDFIHAGGDIVRDVTASFHAQQTVGLQTQLAQQLAAQQLGGPAGMAGGVDLSHMKGPNRQQRRHPGLPTK